MAWATSEKHCFFLDFWKTEWWTEDTSQKLKLTIAVKNKGPRILAFQTSPDKGEGHGLPTSAPDSCFLQGGHKTAISRSFKHWEMKE